MVKKINFLGVSGLDPLAYLGVENDTPSQATTVQRAPLTDDYNGYFDGHMWLDTPNNDLYILIDKSLDKADLSITAGPAEWLLAGQGIGEIFTISTPNEGPISPTAGNINIIGAGEVSVTGNPGASELTIAISDAVPLTFIANSGSAVPDNNTIRILGGTNVTTTASAGTITISLEADTALNYRTDDNNVATPAGGVLTINGIDGLDTSGAGDTLTFSLTAPLSVARGGTGVTSNNTGRVLIGSGTSPITESNASMDGYLLIGASAADPAFAALTSGGGTVTFTPGPNSLDLDVPGLGNITYTMDGMTTAMADMGELFMLGGPGITTSASGSTVTINADSSTTDIFDTDSGMATPSGGVIRFIGGTGINTSATGMDNLVSINLDSPVLVANGGTGAQVFTDHGVLVGSGTSAITALPIADNGEVLIGASGADPAFNALDTIDGTITYYPGVNSLGMDVVSGFTRIYNADTGMATPQAGTLAIEGANGLTTDGASNSVTISLTTPVPVERGGTSSTAFTPYTVICGGISSTDQLQNVASVGTAGDILLSSGPLALPSFQAAGGTGTYINWNRVLFTNVVMTADEGYRIEGDFNAIYNVTLPASMTKGQSVYIYTFVPGNTVGYGFKIVRSNPAQALVLFGNYLAANRTWVSQYVTTQVQLICLQDNDIFAVQSFQGGMVEVNV